MTRQCSVDGCSKPHDAKGYCGTHYMRFRRYGDALATSRPRCATAEESFAARTQRRGGCLIWTGATNKAGYGSISSDGKEHLAHRWAFEKKRGPIPEGMMVDHICHNPSCVESTHLRLATRTENVRYRKGATRRSRTGIRGLSQLSNGVWSGRVQSGENIWRRNFPPDQKEAAIEWLIQTRVDVFGQFAGNPGNVDRERKKQR